MFSSYFSSIYFNSTMHSVSFIHIKSKFDFPNNIKFSPNYVFKDLTTLRGTHSIELDGFSEEFLFHLSSIMYYLLWILFRGSLNEEIFSSMLKLNSITPIFKSGNPSMSPIIDLSI